MGGGCSRASETKVHPTSITIDIEEYNKLKGVNNSEQKHAKDLPTTSPSPEGPERPSGKAGRGRVVISYSTKQNDFKDRVAAFLTSKNYEAWSGGEVQGGANGMTQWLKKVTDTNTIAIVFILSSAFCRSPACMMEFQWVMQNCQDRLGIIPVMYETFMLPGEMSFMLATVNFIIAQPQV
ncbi:unnamed protein product [Prorocentrum cordatum]|uniref:TIR domain-containing protein n=1 Tax=Prorocentrum cordatum TaxID=2364126 RepID=A0ABN9YBA2_9DINO|nr:unnamed protein product [Polarella glacialis]